MPRPAHTTARDVWLPSSSRCSSIVQDALPQGVGLSPILTALQSCSESRQPVLMACEHTLESVLCAVGLLYMAHADPSLSRLTSQLHFQPQLGETVIAIPDSPEALQLAQRVYAGLERTISKGCARLRNASCPTGCEASCVRKLAYASAVDAESMPEVIHQFARLAFAQGPLVRELSSHEHVAALDALARYTLNECERTRQFARFRQLSDGSFLAVFRPQANTVPFVATHFARRLQGDRFCIVDPVHLVAAFHTEGHRFCEVVHLDRQLAESLVANKDLAPNERYVQAMWQRFYNAIGLPGRDASQRGYDLRVHWMPKRFWSGLPELNP